MSKECLRIARELAAKYSNTTAKTPASKDKHWALNLYVQIKTILTESIRILNSKRSEELSFQDMNRDAISLHNSAINTTIAVSLTRARSKEYGLPSIRLRWTNNYSLGEVIVVPPIDDGVPTYWYMMGSESLFVIGDSKWIADIILSFLLKGTFGIEGIKP